MVMLHRFLQSAGHGLSVPVTDAGPQLGTLGQKKLLLALAPWEESGSAAGRDVWATSLLCSASCTQHGRFNLAICLVSFFALWVPFFSFLANYRSLGK